MFARRMDSAIFSRTVANENVETYYEIIEMENSEHGTRCDGEQNRSGTERDRKSSGGSTNSFDQSSKREIVSGDHSVSNESQRSEQDSGTSRRDKHDDDKIKRYSLLPEHDDSRNERTPRPNRSLGEMIYISAPVPWRRVASKLARELAANSSCRIVSTWHEDIVTGYDDGDMVEKCARDFEELNRCEHVVAFGLPGSSGGVAAEMAYAVALGKRVTLIGEPHSLIHFHPRVVSGRSRTDILRELCAANSLKKLSYEQETTVGDVP